MPTHPYVTLDVFTEQRFGGNPLAVVLDARGLDTAMMQRVAAEFGYSETTFLAPPADPANTAAVRIFTPTGELPFAGHPNVGAAFALAAEGAAFGAPIGDSLRFEEAAGLVEIALTRSGGAVAGATVTAPIAFERGAEIDPADIAACAGLEASAVVVAAHPPLVASVGVPFAIAEIGSLAALGAARPNLAAFEAAEARYGATATGFAAFLYAWGAGGPASGRMRARMFSPGDGIPEDPATGSAAAALGGLLADLTPEPDAEIRLAIDQGVEMGRPSRIDVTASKQGGAVGPVRVGGASVFVMRGAITV